MPKFICYFLYLSVGRADLQLLTSATQTKNSQNKGGVAA